MRHDSSARRSSTMVAVSVAAVVIPMVVGMLLLPGAEGVLVRRIVCGPNTTGIVGCNVDVVAGTTIQLDCTGSADGTNVPTQVLNGTAANIKVCQETALREDVGAACGTEVALTNIAGMTGVASNSTNGWTADFGKHDENHDVIVAGTCKKADDKAGIFFNFVLKATTTTQTPGNSGATSSAFGLATAFSVALLGLVVAAA